MSELARLQDEPWIPPTLPLMQILYVCEKQNMEGGVFEHADNEYDKHELLRCEQSPRSAVGE